MTSGTINKSLILFLLLCASATVIWWLTFNGMFVPCNWSAIVGLVLVLISAFKPQYSPYLAPGYALFEGLFIGGISAILKPCILNCQAVELLSLYGLLRIIQV
jgi:uncharacterized YccA/Bax inhibitor family protein